MLHYGSVTYSVNLCLRFVLHNLLEMRNESQSKKALKESLGFLLKASHFLPASMFFFSEILLLSILSDGQ